jgi:hypothetical protein
MRRELLENNALTTISGAITAVATTVNVADGSGFPAEGDYRIIVNDEIMLVTARSTNTLTVERGVEGTTGAIQAGGTSVRMILTAGGLTKWMDDVSGGASDRNPFRLLNDGTTIISSGFTWVNQSTTTVIDETSGGLTITAAPSVGGDSLRILKVAAPSAPWILTAHCLFGPGYSTGASAAVMGICAREAATGKLQLNAHRIGQTASSWQFTNETTDATTSLGADRTHLSGDIWLRLEDNNTDMISYISMDGINWWETGRETRGTFPTTAMDEVGLFVNSGSSDVGAFFHFDSWVVE